MSVAGFADSSAPSADRNGTAGVPIAEASKMLRVPMPTLRSWELRYGIPQSERPAGKHRRYTAPELHAMRLMRDEVARGIRAGAAAQSVRALLGVQGPAAELIRGILDGAKRSDTYGIRKELDRAAEVLGLAGCIDEVLLPAMRQIGQWWEAGMCDMLQEHLTTESARAWLDKRSAFAPSPTTLNPIVFACGPGDLHTIGLEALAVLLRHQGWSCRILGARTSTASLVTAAMATGAAGVVIVSHLPTGRRRALASIDAVHDLGIPLFYAGNAFNSLRSRQGLPGTFLGNRMRDAAALVHKSLSR
jgi:methanogenic corrinoid protein MtbC1